MEPSSTGLFGLDREMGYTRAEFFARLPTALSDYDFTVDGDVVIVAVDTGTVRLHVGIERERELTDLVRFPILPVRIECVGIDQSSQAQFIKRFEISFLKGLG